MKYVKLFENFINKYELAKPLPDVDGKMIVENEEECYAVQFELINMGYDWVKFHKTSPIKSERINKIPKLNAHSGKEQYPIVIMWQRTNMKIVRTSIHDDDGEWVKFSDHFKFKTEHRGHNLKRFGV